MVAFRNCQVAAPLKHCGRRHSDGRQGAFRNCQVAAPLKRDLRAPGRGGRLGGLPQLSSCGPIEALAPNRPREISRPLPQLSSCGPIEACWSRPWLPRRDGRLPQLSSCGPIEAHARRQAGRWHGSLPQLSSCGPIEAAHSCGRPCHNYPSFRNCQVAAPLKLDVDGGEGVEGPPFRNCQVAAPLKLIVGSGSARREQPSATVKLRPH